MNDEELMAAVAKGDQLAYQALVRAHLPPIARYALRLLGNPRDTEDIAQETFLRLWTGASRWDPAKAQLTTWLHRIAHNLCVDHLRKQGRLTLTETLDEELEQRAEGEQDAHLLSDGIHEDQESLANKERLDRALRGLSESQRSALLLCHYQGFSNREAADIMGVSVKALESLVARAKRGLRAQLTENVEAQ